MISVLIVEDVPADRDGLKAMIEYSFPGAMVEIAGDVEEANECILRFRKGGSEFNFVIADVIVPSKAGLSLPMTNSPEWDKMVSGVDRKCTKLILTSVHRRGDLHDVTIIEKGAGATDRIVTAIAAHIIKQGIDNAFGRPANDPFGREPDSPRGAGTIPIGRVTRDIYSLWRYLDAQNRDSVRRYFDVVESRDDPDRVEMVNFGARE